MHHAIAQVVSQSEVSVDFLRIDRFSHSSYSTFSGSWGLACSIFFPAPIGTSGTLSHSLPSIICRRGCIGSTYVVAGCRWGLPQLSKGVTRRWHCGHRRSKCPLWHLRIIDITMSTSTSRRLSVCSLLVVAMTCAVDGSVCKGLDSPGMMCDKGSVYVVDVRSVLYPDVLSTADAEILSACNE